MPPAGTEATVARCKQLQEKFTARASSRPPAAEYPRPYSPVVPAGSATARVSIVAFSMTTGCFGLWKATPSS